MSESPPLRPMTPRELRGVLRLLLLGGVGLRLSVLRLAVLLRLPILRRLSILLSGLRGILWSGLRGRRIGLLRRKSLHYGHCRGRFGPGRLGGRRRWWSRGQPAA